MDLWVCVFYCLTFSAYISILSCSLLCSHVSNELTNNWKIVTDKYRKSNRIIREQLPIPVIPITNRFNALDNLKNDLELPRNIENHHIEDHHKKNVFSKQNKTISSPVRRKKRILLVAIVICVFVLVNLGST